MSKEQVRRKMPSTTKAENVKTDDDTTLSNAVGALTLEKDWGPNPRAGRLLRLKTLAEIRAYLLLETVYVVKVPVKESNKILK